MYVCIHNYHIVIINTRAVQNPVKGEALPVLIQAFRFLGYDINATTSRSGLCVNSASSLATVTVNLPLHINLALHLDYLSWNFTTPTPTPTSLRGSSPTRPARAISWSYSYGKLNDTPTFSRRSSRGCRCWRRGMRAYHSSHLISSDLISTNLGASKLSAPWLVAATASCEAKQFAQEDPVRVAASNRICSTLGSDEMSSVDIRSDEIRWDLWYEQSTLQGRPI